MTDFSNYELGNSVYGLADGLLPEMAHALDFPLSETPSVGELQALVGHIGPAKELQENISLVQARMGKLDDAVTIAADWVDRSGILVPTSRSFASPEIAVPSEFDDAVITGGVARWMFRRAAQLERVVEGGTTIGRVRLPLGQRLMGEVEHDLVKDFMAREGRQPTEAEFGTNYIVPMLAEAEIEASVHAVDSKDGDEIMRIFAEEADYWDGTVLVLANAPSAIQSAGQLRLAIFENQYGTFDNAGDQLFVSSDTIEVARQGEPAATHQNPYTALGQIARNALFLQKNMI